MQIQWTRFAETVDAQQDRAAARIERLAAQGGGVTDVRITAQPTRHHRRGGQAVTLTCLVRGQPLSVSRESPDLERALDQVIDTLKHRLRTLRGRRRERRAPLVPVSG